MRLLLIVLLLSMSLAAHAGAPLLRADDAQLTLREAAKSTAPGAIEIALVLGGEPAVLELVPNGQLESEAARFSPAIARGEDRLYAGAVAGKSGTWARISRVGGGWIGVVFDGADLWYLEPAGRHATLAAARGLASGATLVYRGDDLDLPQGFDLHGAAPGPGADAPVAALGPLAPAGAPRFLKLTLVLDTEFQAIYGADSASTAAAILNGTDGLYRAQTDIQISLRHLESLADNGPLSSTDANVLLSAFRDYMRTPASPPFSGLAHLLSGKDFAGSTVGLAFVGTVCNRNSAYGINQATFSTAGTTAIVAHEIGHNFSALHDSQNNACPSSGFLMAASSDFATPPTSFSSCSLDYFLQFLDSSFASVCLRDPPFTDFSNGFEPQ